MGGCGGGCDRFVIVVGSGSCWQWVCTGRGPSLLFIVCLLFHGHCGHLCLWASLFVVIMGGHRRLECGRSSSVIVCLDGGGKEKRNHVTLPNKHCLLSMTNK